MPILIILTLFWSKLAISCPEINLTNFPTELLLKEAKAIKTKIFCDMKSAYLSSRAQKKITFQELVDSIPSDVDIVHIGESHWQKSENFYPKLLKAVRKRIDDVNCLLIETNHPYLGDILETPDLKVIHIDAPDTSKGYQPYTPSTKDEWINFRDRKMAKRTSDLIKDGSCKRVVMINGSAHFMAREGGFSLPEELYRKYGLSSFKVNLIQRGIDHSGRTDNTWEWKDSNNISICKKNKMTKEKKEVIFFNKESPDQLPLHYGAKNFLGNDFDFFGSWTDFDATVILP